jgi:hypothetical protein
VSEMEKILGGDLQRELYVPGTKPGEAEQVRYISYGNEKPRSVLHRVVRKIAPAIPSHGAVVTEPCTLTLPDGMRLFATYFHGDIAGWQRQIEEGAQALGLLSGKIEDGLLALSDGRTLPLSDCRPEMG